MLRTALALLLLAATVVVAEVPDDYKKIADLLEDFDYDTDKKDDWLQANNDGNELNMFLKGYKKGVLLQAYYLTSDMDISKRNLRRLCNKLNLNATVMRAYIDGDGDLMLEAWYPGKFDKKRFKLFLTAWHDDTVGQRTRIADALSDDDD